MATTEQLSKDVQDLKVQAGVHEQRLDSVEDEIKNLHIENKAIYEINTNVRLLAENMNTVKNDISDVKVDIKDVKSKNSQLGERFDSELDSIKTEVSEVRNQPNKAKADWFDKVLWAISGGVITFLLSQLLQQIFK